MSIEKVDYIEKFDPHAAIEGEEIPYFMANTKVIQNIKDPIAGFVWVYLSSKPKNWVVVKEHIKKHFDLGDKKIKQIFSYLNACGLIEYIREKSSDGTFVKVKIRVLNGSRFINNDKPVDNFESTGSNIHPVVNHSSGKEGTTNNRYNKNERDKQNSASRVFSKITNQKPVYQKPYLVKPQNSRPETRCTVPWYEGSGSRLKTPDKRKSLEAMAEIKAMMKAKGMRMRSESLIE